MNKPLSRPSPRLRNRALLAGILLILAGLALVWTFVDSPIGTLARWGFPQAWRGAPLLLGAAFSLISGFFLLIQRRFSLAALIVAGFCSAALTAAAQAWVMSIRDRAEVEDRIPLPQAKLKEFVELSRKTVTPEYLAALVRDVAAEGWLRGGIDFDSVSVSYGGDPVNKDVVIVTLSFDFSPYVHPEATGARDIVRNHSNLLHDWIFAQIYTDKNIFTSNYFYAYSQPKKAASVLLGNVTLTRGDSLSNLIDLLLRQQPELSQRTAAAMLTNAAAYYAVLNKARSTTLRWLRDREPNPELKKYFGDTLTEVEAQLQK